MYAHKILAFALCTVVVTAGNKENGLTNVAAYKPASQSSDYQNSALRFAYKAVDNSLTGVDPAMSHTNKDQDAWWKVDLLQSYDVKYIVIYNRVDCCGQRLRGAVIRVGDYKDFTKNTKIGKVTENDVRYEFKVPRNTGGRYVSVQLESCQEFLQLAEVQVFA